MRQRVVLSSTLGNALEWFDFTVFGMFVVVISKLFFPSENEAASLLKTFATFGAAFIARPVGGLLFGLYADRYGRKRALVVMIMLMAGATFLIGVLPTYASIGLAAPFLVLVARLLQGLSAGGEFGSASAMLIEFAPPGRRGLYGSCQTLSQALAFVMGAACGYVLNTRLTPEQFESWGWRIPFLLGILIGPVGIFLRSKVDESPEFQEFLRKNAGGVNTPLRTLLRDHPRELAVAFCLTAAATAITYVNSIFIPAYAAKDLGLKLSDAQLGLVVASLGSACMCPLAAWLSDLYGRRRVIFPALVLFCALYYVMLSRLVAGPSQVTLWQLQSVAVLLGCLAGPMPALMTEIFPVGVRSTGASLMYNLAVMLFGGMAPLIIQAGIEATHDEMMPVYYIIFAACVGLIGLALHRETSR